MTAQIIQFIPRPNPARDIALTLQAMVDATWLPFFAFCDMMESNVMDMDLYARGLAIDTAPSGVLQTSDYVAPDDDCA